MGIVSIAKRERREKKQGKKSQAREKGKYPLQEGKVTGPFSGEAQTALMQSGESIGPLR